MTSAQHRFPQSSKIRILFSVKLRSSTWLTIKHSRWEAVCAKIPDCEHWARERLSLSFFCGQPETSKLSQVRQLFSFQGKCPQGQSYVHFFNTIQRHHHQKLSFLFRHRHNPSPVTRNWSSYLFDESDRRQAYYFFPLANESQNACLLTTDIPCSTVRKEYKRILLYGYNLCLTWWWTPILWSRRES